MDANEKKPLPQLSDNGSYAILMTHNNGGPPRPPPPHIRTEDDKNLPGNFSGENALYSPIKRDRGNGNLNGVIDNKIELEAESEDDMFTTPKLPDIVTPKTTPRKMANGHHNHYSITKPTTNDANTLPKLAAHTTEGLPNSSTTYPSNINISTTYPLPRSPSAHGPHSPLHAGNWTRFGSCW